MVAEEVMEAVDTEVAEEEDMGAVGTEAVDMEAEEDMEAAVMAMGSNGVQECYSKCCKVSLNDAYVCCEYKCNKTIILMSHSFLFPVLLEKGSDKSRNISPLVLQDISCS